MDLKSIVEENGTQAGDWFDHLVATLIVISVVTFSLETLPNLPPAWIRIFYILEWVIVVFFSIEYLLRIYVADKPLRYIFSFWGMIDLLAILPFFLSFSMDLRSLRIFRIFRMIKLVRYSIAMRRLHRAMVIAKEETILFLVMTLIVLYLSGVGIYYFEHHAQPDTFSSIFHSLWWAVTTLTTVGYGDAYPITTGGRFFTFLVLMVGLGIVSVPAGLVASALGKAREMEEDDLKLEPHPSEP